MKILLTSAFLIAALLLTSGGFIAGQYIANESMQKKAVAHSCGIYSADTLEFSWMVVPDIRITADSIAPQVKRGK